MVGAVAACAPRCFLLVIEVHRGFGCTVDESDEELVSNTDAVRLDLQLLCMHRNLQVEGRRGPVPTVRASPADAEVGESCCAERTVYVGSAAGVGWRCGV
jgi:hypothetical protein